MGLHPKKESAQSGKVIFQKVLETARGGFTLDPSGLSEGNVIPAGTPISFDETTRKARILKTAKVYETAGGSATTYKVEKGHLLKVGEYAGATVGGPAYAITAIDTSNSAYDTITVGTTIGAASAGAALFQSSATGASSAALMVTAKGLSWDDVEYAEDASVSVVLRGTLYARRAPAVPSSVVTGLPLIIFSNSY
ncbi:hypothetical protein [Flavihumibacter petaseus]|uniref:Uncharacterized protein n=1 Tax=Flavihumibacter petaseus NBRC 106054 TaxID=1220578 RepID=A0A0E9N353_9BACT|nr:hypothetical protein [Flavihumibacter petaseus]GAO43790.1 hypothetical protein FPE01S_02_08960 [Flavihumibacter petaseus NBRC 106054]